MKPTIKNTVLILIGTVVLAFGTAVFILPQNLVVGGISGLAIVISNILPWDFLSVDLLVTILTWGLFILGVFILGKNFAAKTLLSTIIYPIAVGIFTHMIKIPGFADFLDMSANPELALALSSVFGGVLIGAGCAITFLGGGSTGGVDIIAFIICKFFKKLKSSTVIFFIDATTVALGMFVLKDLSLTLLGILSAFICSAVIDKVFIGSSSALVAEIVTDKADEITLAVIEQMDRTTTILNVIGGYSKAPRKMLKISFGIRQYRMLINIIEEIDKTAFITVYKAHEINGEGWTR